VDNATSGSKIEWMASAIETIKENSDRMIRKKKIEGLRTY
jgi:hypothetical protein